MSTQPEFILPAETPRRGERRIYRLRAGELVWLGSTFSARNWGEWVERLYDEGEFGVDDCVGVKRERGVDPETGEELRGEWIVHPFNVGRSRRLGVPDDAGDQRCAAWIRSAQRRCRKRATHGEFCDTHARKRARR